MNTALISERRTDFRHEVCLTATMEGARNNVRVTDVSEGGCYVDSVCEAYVGEFMTIKLLLPNGEWLEVTGQVAHHFPRLGFGLRFVELSNMQLQTLRWLIVSIRNPEKSLPAKLVLVA